MKKTFIAILVSMIITACASTPASVKIQMAGESLISLSSLFDKVSKHMTEGCNVSRKYTVKTCADFVGVSNKFKASYPAARTLWNSATQFEDKGLGAAAQTAYDSLYADLAPFIAMMGGTK